MKRHDLNACLATNAAPGNEAGPCAEPCFHRDCLAQHRWAATLCGGCAVPIGFGTLYQVVRGTHAHVECLAAVCCRLAYGYAAERATPVAPLAPSQAAA